MMKYFATLPVRRSMVIDTGKLHLLAIIDELNLCRCLELISKQRKFDELTAEFEKVLAKLEELEK
jgi:hypothetical protein